MGRGAPKGRRGRAAVLRGGAAGATVALARFARRAAHLCAGGGSRRGRARGEQLARRVGCGGFCAGERLARGVPADRGSVSTGHAVSLRTAQAMRGGTVRTAGRSRRFLRGEAVSARRSCGQGFSLDGPCGVPADSAGRARGNGSRGGSVAAVLARGSGFRAAFLRTVTGPRRPLRGETASARSSRPAPLPPPASGQEMAGDRVVSVAGDLPCERMRPRAGVCQSLFLRDWVFLPSSIIILKVTASSNERRSSPMARCTFSSRYTSVLRWM